MSGEWLSQVLHVIGLCHVMTATFCSRVSPLFLLVALVCSGLLLVCSVSARDLLRSADLPCV
jgi:hypothetical protein